MPQYLQCEIVFLKYTDTSWMLSKVIDYVFLQNL